MMFPGSVPKLIVKPKLPNNTPLIEMMAWALKNNIRIGKCSIFKEKITTFYFREANKIVSIASEIKEEDEPLAVLIDALRETKRKIENEEWND